MAMKCGGKGEGFLGVCLEWAPLCRRCLVVNVYSKCDLLGKQRLWENLVVLRNFYGYWSVGVGVRGVGEILGDFFSLGPFERYVRPLSFGVEGGCHQLGSEAVTNMSY
ncbi:hypothetical protein MTR_8g073875 [Medicago truncatula]|uniref:Uncharacterized protein n=1 Tax=Medicago truncatula TaxID=3880 RepID=A0A072TSB3_MEDTR|nr:hypothetical protein MTR_8g073875 [Medicago truncatula]